MVMMCIHQPQPPQMVQPQVQEAQQAHQIQPQQVALAEVKVSNSLRDPQSRSSQ